MISVDLESVSQKLENVGVNLGAAKKELIHQAGKIVVKGLIKTHTIDFLGSQVGDRFGKVVDIQWSSPEAKTTFVDLKREGLNHLGYGAHFVHIDGSLAAEANEEFEKVLFEEGLEDSTKGGMVVTVAITAADGTQDPIMSGIYSHMKARAARQKAHFLEVTREKDVREYGLKPANATSMVLKLRRGRTSAMIFPYGSINAGRLKKDGNGELNGIAHLVDPYDEMPIDDHFRLYNLMTTLQGQEPFWQPMGFSYSYELQNPDTLKPRIAALISLYDRPSNFLKQFGFRRRIARVNLGTPITGENMGEKVGSNWKENIVDSNNYLMEEIARLVLPHERGEYSYIG